MLGYDDDDDDDDDSGGFFFLAFFFLFLQRGLEMCWLWIARRVFVSDDQRVGWLVGIHTTLHQVSLFLCSLFLGIHHMWVTLQGNEW